MEDFAWVFILVLFWIFSAFGEFRKSQQKRQGERRRESSRERDEEPVQLGPAAGRRDLGRDVEEGARRAEEALRRWEARQRADAPVPVSPPTRTGRTERAGRRERPVRGAASPLGRPDATARRAETMAGRATAAAKREAEDERREAYEAIAGMLADREIGAEQGERPEVRTTPASERRPLDPGPAPGIPLARPARPAAGGLGRSGPRPSNDVHPLARLERLPALQRAVVLKELLGPPKALSPESDLF